MLRISKLTDAEYVLGQVASGLEDYYLGSGEAPGVWAGRLAAGLGLEGVVEGEVLRALLDRRHPETGVPLVVGGRPVMVKAFDVTFSAPKSVSLLHALGNPVTASVVGIAHVEAVAAALGFLEEQAAVTRRQVDGVRRRAGTSGWAAATFVHRTSREGDPQLHTHTVIPNLVRRADGRWVSIDAAELYRWGKAAGSVYQEQLRRHLAARLGVTWGPDRNGCRELVGVDEGVLRVFSKRTAQIEAHLAADGTTPATAKERMEADERASLATRRHKNRAWTHAVLSARWQAEAASVGLRTGAGLVERLRQAAGTGPTKPSIQAIFDLLVDPETGLCGRDSRFSAAQVIERVAAAGAGTLSVTEITGLTRRFLGSDLVVRLIDRDPSGRTPPRYSTRAHRQVEDRLLDHLEVVAGRTTIGVPTKVVEEAIGASPGLGDDQAGAVPALCGTGPALRLLTAPAGHGKTTTLATAVAAVAAAGRAVLAVSTTNQAVDQLRQAGLPAITVARFALDCPHLADGTVIICDEFSQLSTREADTLFAAAAACPDGQVWMVGDTLQAQPVAAGGLAHYLTAPLPSGPSGQPRMITAGLSVNRRQADPAEQAALGCLRAGDVPASQTLRDAHGWEHHAEDPAQAVEAMAVAVTADIARYGAQQVAALAVTHTDCEQLADQIRAQLAAAGQIAGPVLDGPGWAEPRRYQAGDRILLHAHLRLPSESGGGRLYNGTTATVIAAGPSGLLIAPGRPPNPNRPDQTVAVPAGFVQGHTVDGRPYVSHAWARTIDGVQGGTFAQVHLLATPAIDRYRGYVGQSRGVQPTHTWNTIPAGDDDHGGRKVTASGTPAEQVGAGLARAQPKTFAALDDPWRADRNLRAAIDRHREILADPPPDVTGDLDTARAWQARAQRDIADSQARARHWQEELAATAGLRGVTRSGRNRHARARTNLDANNRVIDYHAEQLAQRTAALEGLQAAADHAQRFQEAHAWRHTRIHQLETQLGAHWAAVIVAAARTGDPYAYGQHPLQHARQHLQQQLQAQTIHPTTGPASTISASTDSDVDQARQALTDLDTAIAQHRPAPTPPRWAATRPDPAMDIHTLHQHYQHVAEHTAQPGMQPQL